MPEQPLADSQPIAETAEADQTSQAFVGRWNHLVSTTNWEKGRIIYEWREALFLAGAAPQLYSDEAWSRRVAAVSSQHVGRLRRVHERFGAVQKDYADLYWSHFQAALDWNDAEMWLEGAVQNGWSISQMRNARWEALGAPAGQQPRAEEVVAAEMDEDAARGDDHEPLSGAARGVVRDPDAAPADADGSDSDAAPHDDEDEATPRAEAVFDAHPPAESEAASATVRPFEQLAELPDDLADAFDAFKLAILRHKLAEWSEIARDDVLASLEALKQLALAPAE